MDAAEISLDSCDAGKITFSEEDVGGGFMFGTANGGMLVEPSGGIIFAAPQLSAPVATADLQGVFSGFVFVSGQTQPAKVTLNTSGVGTGTPIDPESDVELSSTDEVALVIDTPVDGLDGVIRGTIDSRPLNCVVSVVAGERLLACNGADSALIGSGEGAYYNPFFFLGVKR